jgi:ribose transport system substrate-binding protein
MYWKRIIALVSAALLASGVFAFAAGNAEAGAKAKGFTIGFSNSYGGNTYRQTMEALFKKLADKMVADGTLKSYKMLQSNNNVATQVSQIESLILDGVNAIIIDPGSASGLNGAIEKAVKAGIPVIIVNDGPVTTDQAYQINWDTNAMAADAVKHLADIMGGKGTIIEIRGLAGVPYDDAFHASALDALKAYPNIKVVGSIYGEWTESVAQQQVASILPGIPQIDGVLGQGGDEYGALQAFIAAGRNIPVIIGGNRGNFLKWWADQKTKNGYKSFSWGANPWSAASSLYVAVDLLKGGVKVPKEMIMPALSITQEMVDNFANLKADEVAAKEYDHDWIVKTYYNK